MKSYVKMNPDIEYELSADAIDNLNLSRIKIGLNKIKPFTFTKTGEFLEFDWKQTLGKISVFF